MLSTQMMNIYQWKVIKLSTTYSVEPKKLTEENVVWVKPDRYWRYRVNEDEPGREARG